MTAHEMEEARTNVLGLEIQVVSSTSKQWPRPLFGDLMVFWLSHLISKNFKSIPEALKFDKAVLFCQLVVMSTETTQMHPG